MTTPTRAQYKQNIKRFRQALSGKFKVQQATQSAYVVGDGHVKIDGRYYDASTNGLTGTVTSVVNVGRPSAAIYATEGSGGSAIITGTSGTSTGTGTGTGTGAPVTAAYLTLALNSALTAERVLVASAPLLLTDGGPNNAATLSLDTPPTLSVSSTNDAATGSHAITSSANPGATESLLKSTSGGGLTLVTATATTSVTTPTVVTSSGDLALSPASGIVTTTNLTGTGTLQGDIVIGTTKLRSPLIDTASGNLSITPAGGTTAITGALTVSSTATVTTSVQTPLLTTASNVDLVINPAGTGAVQFPNDQTLRTSSFDSSFPITGWQINEVAGVSGYSALTIGKIKATEMTVDVFVANETRVDRGDQYWTKSFGIIAETFTTPSSIGGTVSVKFEDSPAVTGAIFTNSDWVLIRNLEIDTGLSLLNIWAQVSSYVNNSDGTQNWTFTLRSGPTSQEIIKGNIAIDFGASGAALIHLSVTDAAGAPYLKLRRWAGANPYTPSNYTTYVQIGNLGSVGNSFYTPAGDGLYIRSTAAEGKFIVADDNGIQIRGADYKAYTGSNQTVNIAAADGSVKLGTNIASSTTTSFDFNGTTGALAITGNLTAATGDVTANSYGLNIAAFNGTPSSWTDSGKGLKFTTNPTTPTASTITGRISGTRRTDVSPNYNMLQIESRGGAAYGASDASVDIVAQDADSVAGLAYIRLSVSTTAANEVTITSQDPSGASSYIGLYGIARTFTVRPYATDTHDLGTSSYYYNHAYIRNLHIDTIVGTPSYSHSHAASDITSGTLDLARIPATLTGKDADTLDGYHASSFALAGSGVTSITGGGGISVSGTTSVTISHADTSSATSADNSGGTVIQDLTVDTYGHVTALASANLDTRYAQALTQGAGISITGSLSGYTIAHSDTSSVISADNSGTTFVQDLTFDTYGHVTGIVSADAATALDARYVNVTGDTMTGPLVMNNTTIGDLAGLWSISGGGVLSMAANTDVNHALGRAIVGYGAATDSATFAHYDQHTSTNFGFAQYANGASQVNAVTGQEVSLSINDVATVSVTADRLLPRGNTVVHLGDYNRKFGEINATVLKVQQLVAQEVISTIGGQILVSPTNELIADVSSAGVIGGTDVIYTNMISYWSLDQATGTRLDSKSTNHLTDKNTVTSTTGKIGAAAEFNSANSERLFKTDNAELSTGDIQFYVAAWVYATLDDGTAQCVVSKGGASGDRSWELHANWATNKFDFTVYSNANAATTVSTGTITTSTWYFVECWHDSVSNTIGVAINRTETTSAYSNGVKDDTGNFTIGARNTGNYLTGRVDELGFWKNYIPDSTRKNFLYNSGTGRSFTDIFNYGAGSFSLDVKYNNYISGEFVHMFSAPGGIQQEEVFQITSAPSAITGGWRHTAVRNLNGTGPFDWVAGDALTSLGSAVGSGYINMTATSTIAGHDGPVTAYYVRTGMGAWDAVVPVVADGNLRSFVDYTGDQFGHAAGNDLLLTPELGFKGYTIDTLNGMRTFNLDIALYEAEVPFLNIGTVSGIDIETNDLLTNDNRAISFNRSGQERAYIKAYESASVNTLRLVTTATAGLDTTVLASAYAPTAKIATARLQADQVTSGVSSVTCYQPSTATSAYVSLVTTGTISFNAAAITISAPVTMFDDINFNSNNISNIGTISGTLTMAGDIDMNGNHITDIGTLGETWTALSFNTGWGNLSGAYNALKYKKAGDLVMVRGLVVRSSGSSATIATLPSGYRPATEHIFVVASASVYGEVRITTGGAINLQIGAATTWVSLDNIVFSTLA